LLNCLFGASGKCVDTVADAANAGISLLRGDYVGAGVNAVAILPVVGDGIKAGKMATKAAGAIGSVAPLAVKSADDVLAAGKGVAKAQSTAKGTSVPGKNTTSREMVQFLTKNGFEEVRQSGSHLTLKHSESGRTVQVPMHKGTLKIGTLKSILKQAGFG